MSCAPQSGSLHVQKVTTLQCRKAANVAVRHGGRVDCPFAMLAEAAPGSLGANYKLYFRVSCCGNVRLWTSGGQSSKARMAERLRGFRKGFQSTRTSSLMRCNN